MAKTVKTLQRKVNKDQGKGFAHRTHRSKKNEKSHFGREAGLVYKKRRQALREDMLYNE